MAQLPEWLQKTKDDIAQLSSWDQYQAHLAEEIRQQMERNHIRYFSELQHSERIVMVATAEQKLSKAPFLRQLQQV